MKRRHDPAPAQDLRVGSQRRHATAATASALRWDRPSSYAALAAQARSLADLLASTRRFWDQRPYRERPAPWEADLPELSTWLRSLTTAQIDSLERDPFGGPPLPFALAQLRDRAAAACAVPGPAPRGEQPGDEPLGAAPMRRVKGRKEAQIRAFQREVLAPMRAARLAGVVDWCGGKGHLSRSLGQSLGCPVCVVDVASPLVVAAETLGAAAGVDVTGVVTDVTAISGGQPSAHAGSWDLPALHAAAGLVALHACGDLTDAAVRAALARNVRWLAVVPCCHHRAAPGGWRPLSKVVAATGLTLSANALRLAIADEGPATPAVRARRRKEMAWRVGVDLLLAEVGQGASAEPLGTIRRSAYNQPFAHLCQQALASRGLTLPIGWDADAHLGLAEETTRVIRGLALARGQLRRAVETLCVVDRALALAEAGWQVSLRTFCDREVTPRNLMIVAVRDSLAPGQPHDSS